MPCLAYRPVSSTRSGRAVLLALFGLQACKLNKIRLCCPLPSWLGLAPSQETYSRVGENASFSFQHALCSWRFSSAYQCVPVHSSAFQCFPVRSLRVCLLSPWLTHPCSHSPSGLVPVRFLPVCLLSWLSLSPARSLAHPTSYKLAQAPLAPPLTQGLVSRAQQPLPLTGLQAACSRLVQACEPLEGLVGACE